MRLLKINAHEKNSKKKIQNENFKKKNFKNFSTISSREFEIMSVIGLVEQFKDFHLLYRQANCLLFVLDTFL